MTDDERMGELGAHLDRIRELADAVEQHRSPRHASTPAPVPIELLPLAGAAPRPHTNAFVEEPEETRGIALALLYAFVSGVLYSVAALACAVLLGAALLHLLPSAPRPAISSAVAIHDAPETQP